MSARITADNVRIERRDPQLTGGVLIEAHVRGQRTTYVVDYNPAWGDQWYCSCGRAPGCPHIRATREVVSR
ncbi:hypothetical protein [Jiangella asiatica]|uniref:SWIM-type domain-containing protein n=1 Tax=Jiangella asiatica TaxID=2530372 RepID=A0A4R5CZV2_9ACTN|nr:hypothetical protein [Jiangella asiatica]TDE03433.1 hypothetical protein E1269_20560 [Jiangella asiatica]